MKVVVNGTCINGIESGAKNRFRSIYNFIINKNPNIHFYILEPKDYSLENIINKKENVSFIKTKCLSYFAFQRYLWSIFTIPRIIKKIQPDVYEQSHLPLLKIPNVKIIFTIHDIRYSVKGLSLHGLFRPSFISNFFLAQALKNSDKIITVSHTVKNEINKLFQNNNTEVVYNPIKFDSNNLMLKKELTQNSSLKVLNEELFFLSVGSFEKRKNYETIIFAAYLLNKIGINVKFCFVGFQTEYLKYLKKIIKNLGLSNDIFLYHVAKLYINCYAFIYASRYEGFGIPLIEAINFNCNIILSNIRVFREITDNKGIFFNNKSPEDLCHRIIETIYNEINKFKINKNVLDKFTLDKITNKIVELY